MDFEMDKKLLVEYICGIKKEPINDEIVVKMAENLVKTYPEKLV